MMFATLQHKLLGIVATTAGIPLSARILFLTSAPKPIGVEPDLMMFSPMWCLTAVVKTMVEESNSRHRLETFEMSTCWSRISEQMLTYSLKDNKIC